MRPKEYTDRITEHEDWKDGMNRFRSSAEKEITEIYKSIADIRNLTLKLAEYVQVNTEILDNIDSDREAKTIGTENESL
tara:strand:- start:4403 stop:4639 length:237 start_codon:yes stop_codon:yes gene_type:complete